jgi:hypothetical protein
MITEIANANYLGLDSKGRDCRGGCAVIECNGVRFFSLTPKDQEDADRINKAVDIATSLPQMKVELFDQSHT